jgi:hypothetical protein
MKLWHGFSLIIFFLQAVISVPVLAQDINKDADLLLVSIEQITPGSTVDATNFETDVAILKFTRAHKQIDVGGAMWYIAAAVERSVIAKAGNGGPEKYAAVVVEMKKSPGLRRLLGYVAAYCPLTFEKLGLEQAVNSGGPPWRAAFFMLF